MHIYLNRIAINPSPNGRMKPTRLCINLTLFEGAWGNNNSETNVTFQFHKCSVSSLYIYLYVYASGTLKLKITPRPVPLSAETKPTDNDFEHKVLVRNKITSH